MSHNKVNSLIMQNRLLSQARSGTRARNAAIGSALGKTSKTSNSSNSSNSISSKSRTNVLQTVESKNNYTSMKSAGESIQEHAAQLQKILSGNWEELTEEETAKLKSQAENEINGFIQNYNTLIQTLSKESGTANSTYLKQLQNYAQSAKNTLAGAGILSNSDGTLSVDKELLRAADHSKLQEIFGRENSFADKVAAGAEKIAANAETNLSLLNKNLYAGNYSYTKNGNDIFDTLMGLSSKYNILS